MLLSLVLLHLQVAAVTDQADEYERDDDRERVAVRDAVDEIHDDATESSAREHAAIH